MKNKKYLVTNNGEGSICVSGRTRIDIPGLCKDVPLELPEVTAKATIARLKQRYPLLKIRDAQEEQGGTASTEEPTAETGKGDAANGSRVGAGNSDGPDADKGGADLEKSANTMSGAGPADSKSGAQNISGQDVAATPKADNKKSK